MRVQNHKLIVASALALTLVFVLGFLPNAFSFANGEAASLVIGQTDYTTGTPGDTSAKLHGPVDTAFDASGNLWVVDFTNNRVLEFAKGTGFVNGEVASVVIGQASFTADTEVANQSGLYGPYAIAFDSSGNLWVADEYNNRVLEFAYPFSNHEAASVVIGQASFTSNTAATTSTGLSLPSGLAFDPSGNLWVADYSNNRVLEYPLGTGFTNGETASVVIGQASFTSSSHTLNSTGLELPVIIKFDDSGNLWVADYGYDRVLEYAHPFSNHEAASVVIGEASFTSVTFVTNSTNLNGPEGLAFDSGNNLWVADGAHDRVLEFAYPFSNHEAASIVIGQASFTTESYDTTSTTLHVPAGLAFDSFGNLWVADYSNNRVVAYAPGAATTSSSTPAPRRPRHPPRLPQHRPPLPHPLPPPLLPSSSSVPARLEGPTCPSARPSPMVATPGSLPAATSVGERGAATSSQDRRPATRHQCSRAGVESTEPTTGRVAG